LGVQDRRKSGVRRRVRWLAGLAAALVVPLLSACGSGGDGPNTISWWMNPDSSGTQEKIAQRCTAQSNGRYQIKIEVLPQKADAQREQLVRRLAAKDSTVNLVYVDVPWTAEFAAAGWLREWTGDNAAKASAGMLEGPLKTARWRDRLYAAPFTTNTQLLWYRKSLAQQAGIDPSTNQVTWNELIDAASRVPQGSRFVEVQADRYEGYTVLINALTESAGGHILDNPAAGARANPALDSEAGRAAAGTIQKLASSPAADNGISTSGEETTRAAFQNGKAWAMVNWPYIYETGRTNAGGDPQFAKVFADYAWARYPRVAKDRPSAPPLGGSNLGVGAYTPANKLALTFEAANCITSLDSQTFNILGSGSPAPRGSVYDNPDVRQKFPFVDLIRDSVNEAAPRPLTPYYNDVTIAVQRTFHPPASVNPAVTPKKADKLISDALGGKVLL
jgi:multiple sugar transport system substrate-binding protein